MLENGALSFFPILSSTKTPTYDMAKLCNRVLKLLIGNDYSLKDSFSFDRQVIGRTQYIIFHDKFEPFRRTFGEETELYSNHSDVNFLISFRLETWCYIENFLGNFCEKKKIIADVFYAGKNCFLVWKLHTSHVPQSMTLSIVIISQEVGIPCMNFKIIPYP